MSMKSKQATCHPERKHLAHGLCKPCYDASYTKTNRKRVNERTRQWSAAHPERRLASRRRYRYKIEPEEVQARLNAQDGLCKVCLKVPATDIDHDHKTGKVRSILCGSCNRALGLFQEDPEIIRRAATYLELWLTIPAH